MATPTAPDIVATLMTQADDAQRKVLMRFFKTAPGEYGHGDEFLGLRVPATRKIANMSADLPLSEVPELLHSPWHEVRLCGLLIMVAQFEQLTKKRVVGTPEAARGRDAIVELYLREAHRANNWDLVDLSAPKILGHWLLLPTYLDSGTLDTNLPFKIRTLDTLAASDNLWRQRMSMVCTWKTTQQGDPGWCLRYAERHLQHPHDLMHKAVGWMLREVGKRVSEDLLRQFLDQHVHHMPRTTLRYAIELLPHDERKLWLSR